MDKEMTDGRTAWIRAFETRNMDMLDLLLKESDLDTNFVNKEGLAAILATSYQSNDRGKVSSKFLHIFCSIIFIQFESHFGLNV